MPTPRQEKLAENLIENAVLDKPETYRTVLLNSGYSKTTAEVPHKILSDVGVQQALAERKEKMVEALEARGITPELVAEKVGKLLNGKKELYVNGEKVGEADDLQAIDKGITQAAKFGVGGGYLQDDNKLSPSTVNIVNFINRPEVQEQVAKFEDDMRKLLTTPPNNA